MNENEIKKLHDRVGYSGKSQQWQYGFDLAIRELASREGYKLVPVEPSDEMISAADSVLSDPDVGTIDVYKAMIGFTSV